MTLYRSHPNQFSYLVRASAGAPGKDLLPPPRRVLLLWFVSQVICAFLLRNADTYPILELQRGRTEVLNKGGTNFWAPIPIARCPQPSPEVGTTLIEHFGTPSLELRNGILISTLGPK